mmetsp:Transcript_18334/g.41752  ORF Transcript_18334/g.41752 Transcript_18334/m.41752 type:complete len:188 (-) Transcript_18334:112-675(-)
MQQGAGRQAGNSDTIVLRISTSEIRREGPPRLTDEDDAKRRLGLFLKKNPDRRFSNIECSDGMRGVSYSPVPRSKPLPLSSKKLFLDATTDSDEDTDTEDQDGLLLRARESRTARNHSIHDFRSMFCSSPMGYARGERPTKTKIPECDEEPDMFVSKRRVLDGGEGKTIPLPMNDMTVLMQDFEALG